MKHLVLWTEILVLVLVLVALWLDFKFPCDSRVKILLLVVVLIKVALIIYLSRREGEQKGYAKCEEQVQAKIAKAEASAAKLKDRLKQ
jgi:hypothetical protein